MQWRKLGRVFAPDGKHPTLRTHASNPVAEPLGGDLFRVYHGSRDEGGRTHVTSLVMELTGDTCTVVEPPREPLFAPGPLGAFDDSGVSVGCVVNDGPRSRLYYLGWNLGVTVPWRNFVGMAERTGTDGPFERTSLVPVLDRSPEDPFTLSYPFVLRDGPRWRMWYVSYTAWLPDGKLTCGIKHAESDDGRHWRRDGKVVLGEAETGHPVHNRPWVVKDADRYRMWFCDHWPEFRIGYAESADGLTWVRPAGLNAPDVSPGEWDGTMVCYPSVFDHGGRRFMLYNGDRYGLTGFGLAVLES